MASSASCALQRAWKLPCSCMNWKHSPLKFLFALTAKFDVSKIAVYFGGGGHMRAAGCDLQGSVYDVINNVTEQICKEFQECGV